MIHYHAKRYTVLVTSPVPPRLLVQRSLGGCYQNQGRSTMISDCIVVEGIVVTTWTLCQPIMYTNLNKISRVRADLWKSDAVFAVTVPVEENSRSENPYLVWRRRPASGTRKSTLGLKHQVNNGYRPQSVSDLGHTERPIVLLFWILTTA